MASVRIPAEHHEALMMHASIGAYLNRQAERIEALEALLYAATKHDPSCDHHRCHPNECAIAEARLYAPKET